MDAATVAAVLAGAVLVVVSLADVFLTVLFPASGRGPIREPLSRLVWSTFRWVARRAGDGRASLLAYSGPAQITATILAWWVLLILGWAMIYLPAVGESITAASGSTQDSFWTAVYYSGFTQSTLGVGDVVAVSSPYRVLTIIHASTGFAVMTMVLTYFLSVYSVLPGRNSFAMRLHHLTRSTDDSAVLVAVLTTDHPSAVLSELGAAGEFLRHTAQSHRSYPVLRYFHYRADFYALPQLMFTTLEAIALLRSCVDEREYRSVANASVIESTALAAQAVLDELIHDRASPTLTAEQLESWEARHSGAMKTLARHGVAVRPDERAGAQRYIGLRREWDAQLARLADAMLYRWPASVPAAPQQ